MDALPARDSCTGPIRGQTLRDSLRWITLAWCFGAVFVNTVSGAPFTVFAKQLGATAVVFGLITAAPYVAALMQLPASYLIERLRCRRELFLGMAMVQRLLWVGIAWLPLAAEALGPTLRLVVLVGLVGMAGMAGAAATPAWVSWMSDLVPERVRGRCFSRRRMAGQIIAVPASLLTGLALDVATRHGPEVLTLTASGLLMAAALCGVLDIKLFHNVAHPAQPEDSARPSLREVFGRPLANRDFRRYLAYSWGLNFSLGILGQYVWLWVLDQVGISKTLANVMLFITPQMGLVLGMNFWGRRIDRFGSKPVLALASMGIMLLPSAWLLVRPGLIWPGFVLTFIGGLCWAGVEQGNFTLLLRFSADGGRSSYTALSFAIASLGGAIGAGTATLITWAMAGRPLVVAGWSLSFYEVLFLLSTLVRTGSVLLLMPRVGDARAEPAHQSVRTVLAGAFQALRPSLGRPFRRHRDVDRPSAA